MNNIPNCDRDTACAIFRRKSIDIERPGKIPKIPETDFIEIYYRNTDRTDNDVRQTGQFDGNIEKNETVRVKVWRYLHTFNLYEKL
jgi:hypothetical protein